MPRRVLLNPKGALGNVVKRRALLEGEFGKMGLESPYDEEKRKKKKKKKKDEEDSR